MDHLRSVCNCNAGDLGLELAPGFGCSRRTTRKTRGVRNVVYYIRGREASVAVSRSCSKKSC